MELLEIIAQLSDELRPDMAFFIVGRAADYASTYYFCKKLGPQHESNISARELMRQYGISGGLSRDAFIQLVEFSVIGLGLYGIDSALGISDKTLNMHHAFYYSLGSLSYSVSAANFFFTLGFKKLGSILAFPGKLYVETIGRGNYLTGSAESLKQPIKE